MDEANKLRMEEALKRKAGIDLETKRLQDEKQKATEALRLQHEKVRDQISISKMHFDQAVEELNKLLTSQDVFFGHGRPSTISSGSTYIVTALRKNGDDGNNLHRTVTVEISNYDGKAKVFFENYRTRTQEDFELWTSSKAIYEDILTRFFSMVYS